MWEKRRNVKQLRHFNNTYPNSFSINFSRYCRGNTIKEISYEKRLNMS